MTTTIDLTQREAARRETLGEQPAVAYRGESFALPAELPLDVVYATRGRDLDEMSDLLVGIALEILLDSGEREAGPGAEARRDGDGEDGGEPARPSAWARFAGLLPPSPTARDLLRAAFEHYAVSPGESPGSAEP